MPCAGRRPVAVPNVTVRTIALILFLVGLVCEAFAFRGLETRAGRRAFDEMAGMIPLAAAPVGLLFVIAAIVIWWRSRRERVS